MPVYYRNVYARYSAAYKQICPVCNWLFCAPNAIFTHSFEKGALTKCLITHILSRSWSFLKDVTVSDKITLSHTASVSFWDIKCWTSAKMLLLKYIHYIHTCSSVTYIHSKIREHLVLSKLIISQRWRNGPTVLFGGLRQMHADTEQFIMNEGDVLRSCWDYGWEHSWQGRWPADCLDTYLTQCSIIL